MKIVKINGVEMVELDKSELHSLETRLEKLDSGESKTYTDDELDLKWKAKDSSMESWFSQRS